MIAPLPVDLWSVPNPVGGNPCLSEILLEGVRGAGRDLPVKRITFVVRGFFLKSIGLVAVGNVRFFGNVQYHWGERGSERSVWILLHDLLSVGRISYSFQNHVEFGGRWSFNGVGDTIPIPNDYPFITILVLEPLWTSKPWQQTKRLYVEANNKSQMSVARALTWHGSYVH